MIFNKNLQIINIMIDNKKMNIKNIKNNLKKKIKIIYKNISNKPYRNKKINN